MRAITSRLYDRFDHPILASLLGAGIGLFVIAIVSDLMNGGFTAGWFGVYAILLSFIALIGYGMAYAAKYASMYRERQAPQNQ